MSRDRIITQPLEDPVGSIYEVDGKCYIKSSSASGTMNKLIRNPITQECATNAEVDLVKCETGSGARQATISTSSGGVCEGDPRSLENLNFSPRYDSLNFASRESWMLGYSAPGGTLGPRGQGIDTTTIPWHSDFGNRLNGTRTVPDSSYRDNQGNSIDRYYTMHWCKILHGGWIRFTPATVIRGFDEFLFWSSGRWPFLKPVGYYTLTAQHAETDEFHHVATYTASYFRLWLGYMLGYTEEQTNTINPRVYAYGGSLHPYIHLTPRNDNPLFQVDPKFHNMPVKTIQVQYVTGTMFTWSAHLHALQVYKNGEKISLMDNSIVLRSAPAKGHGALM